MSSVPLPGSRLHHIIGTRRRRAEAQAPLVFAHRETLIFTLGKAAALEHLVMCQYLYTAFSLKEKVEEGGLTAEQVSMVKRWKQELLNIGGQEMLHLALVQNVLTAVGGAPRLARPNFPLSPQAYPAGIVMALLPFGEASLRHFAFLERPEGMAIDDAEGLTAVAKAAPLAPPEEDQIGPQLQDFDTIGHLYRSIEAGLEHLAGKLGPERLFIGPPRAQATATHFGWEELSAVTDLASARAAIETIVEQGEGARGEWKGAHFGRIVAILDEYLAELERDPGFDPVRPVLTSVVRPLESGAPVPLITDHFSNRCVDLFNAVYEILLQLLARYFAHTDETDEQLQVLADVTVGLMFGAIKPLGALITRLPVGADHPGLVVGPSFELFYEVDYLLPHREAAWQLIEERIREVAELAVLCRDLCVPTFMMPLMKVTQYLQKQADILAAAR